jgi:ADP-heptose:LPS heptosyltransferase
MRDLYFEVPGWPAHYSLSERQVLIRDEETNQVYGLYKEWSREHGDRFYALHLDSSETKMWPVINWVKVISHIWSHWRAWPFIVGLNTGISKALQAQLPFVLKPPTDVKISMDFAVVKLAPAFVGIDSVFAHVADSYQKPMVVLFGAMDPALWGPCGPGSAVVRPDNRNEMRDISVRKVIEHLGAALTAAFGNHGCE